MKKWRPLALLSAFCLTVGVSACGETTEGTEELHIAITAPTETVYPYAENAKEYLLATRGEDVGRYLTGMKDSAQDIVIEWECSLESVSGYRVEYYSKTDKSDLKRVDVAASETSVAVRNLYKGAKYQVSVSALVDGKVKETAKAGFETTSLGPRVMSVDGIFNVRDLGGYATESGKTTTQGLIYRGGALIPYGPYEHNLTAEGKVTMAQEMRIKTELDLRGYGQESGYLTESPIPEATLEYITVSGYASAFSMKDSFKSVFSFFADIENYPVYMHCTGGADRTGTVAFLLNALLGVSETDLIHDYEFTSFSVYGQRNSIDGTEYGGMFQEFLTKLKSYEGETLSEKTETYMLSIGVTQEEIDSIRTIMLGE